ncbi:nuclear transport factor 2 family protein [Cerasicoccus frondis]|uniref:nuclear transport factor 2 family protein n=1 Tax=Cerasicoccus frondis TaxID=490090 RepID=UPI0028528135|nr:nuclear transport factor 2 family protein [Cerasicoccus frondis]
MKTNTTYQLPNAVTRYVEAVNRFDAAGAAACFTPDASVHDEQEDHVGSAAIESWVSQTSLRYQPHATVMSAQMFGDQLKMTVRVAGNFPGSPADLNYELRMSNEQISELSIL